MKVLEKRQFASIEELAQSVAKSTKTVIKDLEFMIEQKWFLEGRMDDKNPIEIRNTKEFSYYHNLIWKELEKNV